MVVPRNAFFWNLENATAILWRSFKVNQATKIIETKFSPSRIINSYIIWLFLVRNTTLTLFKTAPHSLTHQTCCWKELKCFSPWYLMTSLSSFIITERPCTCSVWSMLGVNKFEANYLVLSQQFCLSIIDQQRQAICITRAVFFIANFRKKCGLFCSSWQIFTFSCPCCWLLGKT